MRRYRIEFDGGDRFLSFLEITMGGVINRRSTMLEIREHYGLDDAGLPIAIPIPVAQFERLLEMLRDPNAVTLVQDDEDLRDEVIA